MNKVIGIALLALGVVLLVFGATASDSFASHISKFFTGNPTHESMWLLIGGIASLVLGGTLTLLPAGKR